MSQPWLEELADKPVPVKLGIYSMGAWSVSKLKTLERCPLQFYLKYVAKISCQDGEDPDKNLNRNVGIALHCILENMTLGYTIEQAKALGRHSHLDLVTEERWHVVEEHYPTLLRFFNRIYELSQRVDILSIEPELQLAIDKNFKPVSFFSEEAFFRGVEDFSLRTVDNRCLILDHKRGGNPSYGLKIHRAQLNTYLVLEHFGRAPVASAKAGIHFLEANAVVLTESVSKASIENLLPNWLLGKIGKAVETVAQDGKFNHCRGSMCKYCEFEHLCAGGKRGTAGQLENLKIATFKSLQ